MLPSGRKKNLSVQNAVACVRQKACYQRKNAKPRGPKKTETNTPGTHLHQHTENKHDATGRDLIYVTNHSRHRNVMLRELATRLCLMCKASTSRLESSRLMELTFTCDKCLWLTPLLLGGAERGSPELAYPRCVCAYFTSQRILSNWSLS